MRKIDKSDLLFHVLTPILLGSVIGIVFKDYTSSIEDFNRNIIVPPILFPILWSILYLLIGVWFYKYEKEANTSKKILYYVLLGINFLFTPTLFYYKNIVLSTLIVLVLLGGNFILFLDSIKSGRFGYLLVPYLMWLSFAFILMMDLFINNVL